jgi:hypothetical protein
MAAQQSLAALCVVHLSMFAEGMAHGMTVYKPFVGADRLSSHSTRQKTFQINVVNVGFAKCSEQIQFSSI